MSFGPKPDASIANLSADGSTIVYRVGASAQQLGELRIRRVNGFDLPISSNGGSPSISHDGQTIAFIAPVNGTLQAFVHDRDSGSSRAVTQESEGIVEAVLSGTNGLLVATTGGGRLLSVDTRNGFRSGVCCCVAQAGAFRVGLLSSTGAYSALLGAGFDVHDPRRATGAKQRTTANAFAIRG